MKINPVLLVGGSGKRLWPLSRKSYPKQFSRLIDENTLFQSSARRLISSDILAFDAPLIMTHNDYRFIVSEQLHEVGIDPGPILIEPVARNTAPAILAASIYLYSKDQNAVILAAPTDHLIPDVNALHRAIRVGLSYLQDGYIVTFGVDPTRPETGYGYLELSTEVFDLHGTSAVQNFVEKPNIKNAENMVRASNFLWNAGIFLFRAKDMIAAFTDHAPKIGNLVRKAVEQASADLGFLRLAVEPWSAMDDISIDYAIMEKIQNLLAIPYAGKWNDLGGWDAVWFEGEKDESMNVTSTSAHVIDCESSLLRSEDDRQQIVGIGLKDIIAIAMQDAVLVAHKDRGQDVKEVVKLLQLKEIAAAENFPKDFRPWGWFESLSLGDMFQVKRLYVKPGGALSLQSHLHRSEHWIVVEGIAHVTINDGVQDVVAGQSVYIPKGAIHRIENKRNNPMILIEVQTGSYFGEDDIIRYEDVYGRS